MKEGVDEARPEAIPRRAWIILGILGSVGLVTTYGETMIIPAIPDLIHEFDINWNINWNHNSFVSRRNVNWASNFRNVHGAISVQC